MLGGVLDLRSLQVLDIMVHRTKMQTINIDDAPEKVVDEVMKSSTRAFRCGRTSREHRRRRAPRTCRGAGACGLGCRSWTESSRGATLVRARTTSVNDQLNEFLKRKAQLALVVDEYGEVQAAHAGGHPGGDRRPDRR